MDIILSYGSGARYGPVCQVSIQTQQRLTDKSELFQAKRLDKPVQTDAVSVCRRDGHLYQGVFTSTVTTSTTTSTALHPHRYIQCMPTLYNVYNCIYIYSG